MKGVQEAYIALVQDMYDDSETVIRSCVGETRPFPVKVGVHQGSALRPLLFITLMDVLTAGVQEEAPGQCCTPTM